MCINTIKIILFCVTKKIYKVSLKYNKKRFNTVLLLYKLNIISKYQSIYHTTSISMNTYIIIYITKSISPSKISTLLKKLTKNSYIKK